MMSNGEYMPVPQTEKQKQVEARIDELSEHASRKLGDDRRQFLSSSGGMAAALLAMNEVLRHVLRRRPDRDVRTGAAYAQAAPPRDLFVFDDQLHIVRGTRGASGAGLRALAQGPSSVPRVKAIRSTRSGLPDERGDVWGVWNPALVGLPERARQFPAGAVHQGRLSSTAR